MRTRSVYHLALDGALVVAKNEEFIAQNLSASRSAELVLLERIDSMGKVVPGVQRVIPEELEHIPVPGIAPGTRGNADNRAGRKTVLGIEIVRDHLKFLGRVRIRERHGEVRIVVHVVSAVEHIIRATLAPAVHGGSAFARE